MNLQISWCEKEKLNPHGMSLQQAQTPGVFLQFDQNKMLHPGMEPKFHCRAKSMNTKFSLFGNENYTKIQE